MFKCFVAMGFSHEDTERFYDEVLEPLLREEKVRPTRVDRTDENDPIDEQIYALMKDSELAIADLTYARPSVYYEAGWMRGRGHPVIFTCRRDHFRPKADDVEGTRRVHFDLIHENIIGWTTDDPASFRSRLRARLKKVLKPLEAQRIDREELRRAREFFSGLSQSQQLKEVAHGAAAVLRANGATSIEKSAQASKALLKRKEIHSFLVVAASQFSAAKIRELSRFGFLAFPGANAKQPPSTYNLVLGSLRPLGLPPLLWTLVYAA